MLGRKVVDVRAMRAAHRLFRQAGLLTAIRPLQLSAQQAKWLSKEEAKWIPDVPVGTQAGHPEDPVLHTYDKEYWGSPEKGDILMKEWYYREWPQNKTYLDRVITMALTSFFWFWVLYHLVRDWKIFTGHFYMPYMEEFTDEELGIPPDNAPDPEYWGNHDKPYGTYR
ncbi:Protein F44G4.2 [Aphelenchoides fujianensis]|nr:Protein F44G4.2 [Aphelenchoides fujianensis]